MKTVKSFSIVLALQIASLALVNCSDSVDEVTNNITCNGVCERYKDCFDGNYEVDACTNKCESDATASEEKERRLELCDNCIEDRSCTESFGCADECGGIVP